MSAECTYLHCDWYLDPFADVRVCRTCGQSRAIDELPAPAPSPSQANTSPPSRTSNAASENGTVSLLAFERILKFIAPFAIARDEWSVFSDLELIDSALQQRIEVSGVEGHASANEVPSTQKPTLNRAGIYAEMEPRSNPQGDAESGISAAGINPGLTSSVAQFHTCAHTRLRGYTCERCHREQEELVAKIYGGMQQLKEEAEALVLDPLSEPAIRAAVYGCTDAQCVCGRCEKAPTLKFSCFECGWTSTDHRAAGSHKCPPVRIAVDPWQGLGKTWSDK